MWYVWASHLPSLTFRECWRTFEVWSSERPQCNDREGNQRASPYPHDIKNKMHFSHLREGRNRIRRMMNESRNLQLEPRNGCISQFIACSEFCKTPTKRWFSQHMVDGIVMLRTHCRAKQTLGCLVNSKECENYLLSCLTEDILCQKWMDYGTNRGGKCSSSCLSWVMKAC